MIEPMCYRAVCPMCQGSVLLVVDEPVVMKDCAKDLARAMRDGFAVERVTVEAARNSPICAPQCERRKTARKSKIQSHGQRGQRALFPAPAQKGTS